MKDVFLVYEMRRHAKNMSRASNALGPGVHSASNRNKYQKHKNNVSEE
jgi:hypothetical protein